MGFGFRGLGSRVTGLVGFYGVCAIYIYIYIERESYRVLNNYLYRFGGGDRRSSLFVWMRSTVQVFARCSGALQGTGDPTTVYIT